MTAKKKAVTQTKKVMTRPTRDAPKVHTSDKAPTKADTFPMVSVLPRSAMTRMIEIMKDDVEFAEQIEGLTAARKAMKAELVALGTKYDIPGCRWGSFVVYIRGMKTKRSLSTTKLKEAWVEAGLSLKELDACYTESDPFPDVRVEDLSKPRKGRGSTDDD